MFHRDNKQNIHVKIYVKYSMIHRDNQHNGETAVFLLLVHAISFCNRKPWRSYYIVSSTQLFEKIGRNKQIDQMKSYILHGAYNFGV